MIYQATTKDYNAVREFNNKLLEQHYGYDTFTWKQSYDMSISTFSQYCKRGNLYIMYQDDYVGFAYCTVRQVDSNEQKRHRNFNIEKFYIDAKYRGKGYSKMFLDFLEDIAWSKNCDSIKVASYLENEDAMKTYEAFGFKQQYVEFIKVRK